jgi:hypothetical protein
MLFPSSLSLKTHAEDELASYLFCLQPRFVEPWRLATDRLILLVWGKTLPSSIRSRVRGAMAADARMATAGMWANAASRFELPDTNNTCT